MLDEQQIKSIVLNIIRHVTGLNDELNNDSPLLSAVAEFDSSAILALLTMLEDQFDLIFSDEELDAEHFASVASVYNLVLSKF